jgi:hypothetical protein
VGRRRRHGRGAAGPSGRASPRARVAGMPRGPAGPGAAPERARPAAPAPTPGRGATPGHRRRRHGQLFQGRTFRASRAAHAGTSAAARGAGAAYVQHIGGHHLRASSGLVIKSLSLSLLFVFVSLSLSLCGLQSIIEVGCIPPSCKPALGCSTQPIKKYNLRAPPGMPRAASLSITSVFRATHRLFLSTHLRRHHAVQSVVPHSLTQQKPSQYQCSAELSLPPQGQRGLTGNAHPCRAVAACNGNPRASS